MSEYIHCTCTCVCVSTKFSLKLKSSVCIVCVWYYTLYVLELCIFIGLQIVHPLSSTYPLLNSLYAKLLVHSYTCVGPSD